MQRRRLMVLVGAAACSPFAASAQQKVAPVVGILGATTAAAYESRIAPFHRGLRDSGYVEGHNVVVEYRWADGRYDRLPGLAADLVERKVDLIVAFSPPAALAAKAATSTIPIVFTTGLDPVAAGLADSLARPGRNLTGVSILFTVLVPKLLKLVSELVPQTEAIALLVNPNGAEAEAAIRSGQEAARARRIKLNTLRAATEADVNAAFATLGQTKAGALIIGADPFFSIQMEQLVTLAARFAVPTIYFRRKFAAAGGLTSYAPDIPSIYREVGIYAARILKGAKPANLPVQQPTKFELVINLKTAKVLGLMVPQSLLQRADELIE